MNFREENLLFKFVLYTGYILNNAAKFCPYFSVYFYPEVLVVSPEGKFTII